MSPSFGKRGSPGPDRCVPKHTTIQWQSQVCLIPKSILFPNITDLLLPDSFRSKTTRSASMLSPGICTFWWDLSATGADML